jgi:curved DNA-binding protein CbpA
MTQEKPPQGGLAVLAEAFRSKRTGVLVVGQERAAIRVQLEAGQIVALGPAAADDGTLPRPSDSVRLRLERVLTEIGMRKANIKAPASPGSLCDRLVERLADLEHESRFDDGAEAGQDLMAMPVATEPLILEAVRQVRHDDAVRQALGDLDRRLVATAALADERTLTLTEGYLLSRIDGMVSVREVLELVPLDPQEAERALLGLVLTGRVEYRAAGPRHVEPEPIAEGAAATEPSQPLTAAAPDAGDREPPDVEDIVAEADDDDPLVVEAVPDDEPLKPPAEAPKAPLPVQTAKAPLDAATIERRREILEFFQALPLKNHFEVLGVEPGCNDADVRRAYVSLVKKFHPDAQRDARVEDMSDILEAIFIRVGEAWEVLGEARSRASYEARSGIVRRTSSVPRQPTTAASTQAPPTPRVAPAAPAASQEPGAYVPPEEILMRAKQLLTQARYWDAIQILESALPGMEPRSQQHRGRLLLARAYAKNPNWLRRAEDTLQQLLREDPTNADAHYELGLVYKASGLEARATAMFRRTVELRPGHKDASAELGIVPGEGGGLLKRLFKRGQAS